MAFGARSGWLVESGSSLLGVRRLFVCVVRSSRPAESVFLFLSPYKPCSFLALRFRETSAVVAVAKLGASPPSPPRLFKMTERSEELDSWITNWERQCIEEVESSPDLESQIQNEKDTSSQKLWLLFQNSATCVAQLYKGTHPTPARPRQHRVASCESLKSKNGGDHGNEA